MVRAYILEIAKALQEYGDKKGYTFRSFDEKKQFYEDLSWGGLQKTDAFTSKSDNEKDRILDVIYSEQFGRNRKNGTIQLKKVKMLVTRFTLVLLFFLLGSCKKPFFKKYPTKSPKPDVSRYYSKDRNATYIVAYLKDILGKPIIGAISVDFLKNDSTVVYNPLEDHIHIVDYSGLYNVSNDGKSILNFNRYGKIKIKGVFPGYLWSTKIFKLKKGDSLIVNFKMIEDQRPIIDPVIKRR